MTICTIIRNVAATASAVMGSVVFAAAGEFDPTFNGVGFTRDFIPDFTGSSAVAIHSSVRIQADGQIVISAFTGNARSSSAVTARYLASDSSLPRAGGFGPPDLSKPQVER